MFYDAMGREWFPLDEQRRDVPIEQISTYFEDAVISIEDHRYYLHPGIDPIAVTRAAFFNLRSREGTQGGSTITQQLARTLYPVERAHVRAQGQEAALAVLLGDLPQQEGDPRALFRSRVPERRRLRRRDRCRRSCSASRRRS